MLVDLQRWTRGQIRGSLTGLLVACGVTGALAAPVSATADPGRYDVWSCRGPAGEPVGTSAWKLGASAAASGDVLRSDDCATGGGLTLSLAPDRAFTPGVRGSLTFTAPEGAHVDSWTVFRTLRTAAPDPDAAFLYDYAAALTERQDLADFDDGCASTEPAAFPCREQGDPDAWDSLANRVERTGTPVLDGLALWVGCIGFPCDAPPLSAVPATATLWSARVQVHDLSAPSTPQLSGTLLGDKPQTGIATVVVESADDGGGVAETTLSVDGGTPQVSAPAGPRGTCREPYTTIQPCPATVARAFTVDTTGLADGAHELSGTVADAAGNVTPWGPVAFAIGHPRVAPPVDPPVTPPVDPPPAPPAGNGVPAVRRPRLNLDRTALTRAAGRPVRLTGTLKTTDGTPISGARLDVSVRELGTVDERVRALSAVTSDASGRFAVNVRGGGAERVSISFAPTDGAAETVRAAATVRQPASLTLARSKARLHRGQAVVLSGRLRGTGSAARGAIVELQAIVSGEWRTVGTVRAAADGRYAWRYKFVSVTRDTIFSFRALVRSTPGWPWPQLSSRRLAVRVTPR